MMDFLAEEKAKIEKQLKKKKYLADLEFFDIQSRDAEGVIRELIKLDMEGEPIQDFPIWNLMTSFEDYVRSAFPKILSKIKGPKLTLNIQLNGKDMYNYVFLADAVDEELIPSVLEDIGDELSVVADTGFWLIACDDEHEAHSHVKEQLLNLCAGLQKHQSLQKLKFAAAVCGPKIVDLGLQTCDCLTVKEMSAALKGQPEFLTSYYEHDEIS